MQAAECASAHGSGQGWHASVRQQAATGGAVMSGPRLAAQLPTLLATQGPGGGCAPSLEERRAESALLAGGAAKIVGPVLEKDSSRRVVGKTRSPAPERAPRAATAAPRAAGEYLEGGAANRPRRARRREP
eukprot:557681-Pleurochrysis_carterae.AAC.1